MQHSSQLPSAHLRPIQAARCSFRAGPQPLACLWKLHSSRRHSYRGSTGIVCRASDGGASYRKRQEKAAWDEGEEKVDAAADSEKIEIGAAQVAFEESQVGAKGAAEESQGRAKGAAEESQGRAKGAARSTKANVAGAAADAKSAIQSAEDAAGGGSRKSVRGTSKRLQQGVDDAAGAAQGAARRAGAYADDPQRAVDDAADSAQRGIDSAAESLSQGIEQGREYVEDPTKAVEDAAEGAEEGVDSIAEGLKEGVRGLSQGLSDAADAAEDSAKDAQAQTQPRVGARPLSATYVAGSGAGSLQADTSTSTGSAATEPVQAASQRTVEGAEALDARAQSAAAATERGIDRAAEQVEGAIGAASERLQGVMEDAPRQTAAVVQSVVDSTADSLKRTQAAADEARREIEAPPAAAPFARTPLTKLPPVPDKDVPEVGYFKKRLMYCVAGLDRGFAANDSAELAVEAAIYSLVGAAGGAPELTWTAKEGGSASASTLGQLNGTWRLVYSSGFASGSLGGLRPGPPAALVPVTIGQVYQVINSATATLDNVVEFYARYNVPSLPGGPAVEPIVTTLTLRHGLEVLSGSTVQITFETTEVKATGGLGGLLGRLPEFTLPQLPEPLKPSRAMRSSTFEVIYLDADMRVTRGDRGELRVFLRT